MSPHADGACRKLQLNKLLAKHPLSSGIVKRKRNQAKLTGKKPRGFAKATPSNTPWTFAMATDHSQISPLNSAEEAKDEKAEYL